MATAKRLSSESSKLTPKPKILQTHDVKECREIMQAIQDGGKPVAFDAEGISLSATGRMTLLQICTWDGRVYLLDLMDPVDPDDPGRSKTFLINGGVKDMLESSQVEKVTHACSNDHAALSHQFGIKLVPTQIFDTQAADQTIEFLNGTVFPKRKNLAHLAEVYDTTLHPLKEDHAEWIKEDRQLWARRPLPQKLIDYASYDVTILPELYNKLKGILDKKAGWATFRQHVGWALSWEDVGPALGRMIKDRIQAEQAAAKKDGVKRLFREIQEKYTSQTPVDDFSDDERYALAWLHERRGVWGQFTNQTVEALEVKVQLNFLDDVRNYVTENPTEYIGGYRSARLYSLGKKHSNFRIRNAANQLQTVIRRNKDRPIHGIKRKSLDGYDTGSNKRRFL